MLAAAKLSAQYVGGIYAYGGLGTSWPFGGAASLTFVSPSGWGGSAAFNALWPKAKNLPADYKAGTGLFSPVYIFSDGPTDAIIAVSGRAVRQFPTRTGRLRLNAEVGPSVVWTEVLDRFVPQHVPPDPLGGPANYKYEEVYSTTIGLSLRASIVGAFLRPLGLEIGVFSNINPKRSCVGLDAMLVFGHIRDRL